MARTNAPTLVSYTEIPFNANTSPRSSTSITWNAGDVIVVILGDEGVSTGSFAVPTATGLTFTALNNLAGTGSDCRGSSFVATPTSSGSSTITITSPTTELFGAGIWVWRNSDGVGVHFRPTSGTTQSVSATPTDTHSAFCWGVFDWSATAVGSTVGAPTPTNIREAAQETSATYSAYLFDLTDKATASAANFGISGNTGSGPFTVVGVEILGNSGVTPLTVYLTSTNDTLITTARQLSTSAPASETTVSSGQYAKNATGYTEQYSQGGNATFALSNATGHGFILDSTILEGNTIQAGDWTAAIKLGAVATGFVVTPIMRIWKRSSAGVYTEFTQGGVGGVDITGTTSMSLTTTQTVYSFPVTPLDAMAFDVGDKLYVDILLQITTGSSNNTAANRVIKLSENGGSSERVTTPGYAPTIAVASLTPSASAVSEADAAVTVPAVPVALAPSATAVSAASNTTTASTSLSATASAISATTSAVTISAALTATASAIAATAATSTAASKITATAAAICAASDAVTALTSFSPSASSVSAATELLTATTKLTAAASAISAATELITVPQPLIGNAIAISAATALATAVASLAATAAAIAAATGVVQAGIPQLSPTAAAITAANEAVVVKVALAEAAAAISAALNAVTIPQPFSASAASVATATAFVSAVGKLTAAAAAVSAATNFVVGGAPQLVPTAAAIASANELVTAKTFFTPSASAVSAATELATAASKLSAAAASVSAAAETIKYAMRLSPSSAAVASATDGLRVPAGFIAAANAVSESDNFVSLPPSRKGVKHTGALTIETIRGADSKESLRGSLTLPTLKGAASNESLRDADTLVYRRGADSTETLRGADTKNTRNDALLT